MGLGPREVWLPGAETPQQDAVVFGMDTEEQKACNEADDDHAGSRRRTRR